MPTTTPPILITGAHRSGTTWVGRVLARAPGVGYIHEPFNQHSPPGICDVHFWGPYVYIHARNAPKFGPALDRTLAFDYAWRAQLRQRRPGNLRRTVAEGLTFTYHRLARHRPLVKDPLALMSAAWLADRYNMQVVVLIRHPAAFVSSLKRLDWSNFPFQVFLQKQMVADDVHPYVAQARAYQADPPDVIDQAALVWRILAHRIHTYRQTRPAWIFVRHEDLSRQPHAGFANLYDRLGLRLTPGVRRYIDRTSGADNPAEVPDNRFQHLARDSQANIWTWQDRLTPDEIARVRLQTETEWRYFYADEDWG